MTIRVGIWTKLSTNARDAILIVRSFIRSQANIF